MEKKKKKYPLLITSISCFVGSFVLFFLTAFFTVFLNIISYGDEGVEVWYTIRKIIPFIQIGVPILLIITGFVLFFIALFVEIIKDN